MEMNQNGTENEGDRDERIMYQRGDEVATKVRHQVQDPIVGRNAEYKAQDVMCAMFYMHQQCVAQIATKVRSYVEDIDDLDDEDQAEVLDAMTSLLDDVKQSVGPSDGN